jgi:release factor glutamine methyltransferase
MIRATKNCVNLMSNVTGDCPTVFHHNDLTIELHPDVYDPAEDSFLLLESLTIHPGDTILELGTGCGLIALECARRGATVVCTDINPSAVQLTSRNIKRNRPLLKGTIDIRQGDLFSVLKDVELFDVIVFNPPYLPTKEKERIGGWFDVATDGGRDGLRVTKRFLQEVSRHLSRRGCAYFIASSLSNQTTLGRYLKQERLSACIVAQYRCEDETLMVYQVTPTA